MIVLSARPEFTAALSTCLTDVPMVGGVPIYCSHMEEAAEKAAVNRDGMLAVDLGSRRFHADLVEFVREWRAERPATGLVVVSPCLYDYERHLVAVLGQGAEVLASPQHLDPAAWARVVSAGIAGPILGEIWYDLTVAAHALGRTIEYEGQVLSVLEAAPGVRMVEQYTRRHPTERRKLSSRLNRAFNARTRAMLYGFRLMWMLKLREEEWGPWEIAKFLGYPDSSEAARNMRRFWGKGIRELNDKSYRSLVAVTAAWLTEDHNLISKFRSVNDLRGRVRTTTLAS